MGKLALVCGGGGVWGVAWLSGLVAGLAEAGIDLRAADLFIGTSAGSVTSSQLASGMAPSLLFERQTDPALQPRELIAPPERLVTLTQLLERPWTSEEARLRAVCDLALGSDTVPLAERRAAIEERLGLTTEAWPAKELLLTAIDAASLTLKAFANSDGIALVDAVAASCAIPGVWPPVPIGGRVYVDGGLWKTFDNVQLAAGCARVLLLSPMGLTISDPSVLDDIDELREQGASVVLVTPDAASQASLTHGPLDPACRRPAAEAGRAQGLGEGRRADLQALFSTSLLCLRARADRGPRCG